MYNRTSTSKTESKDQSILQRKSQLRISKSDDLYEKEADKAADAVVTGAPLFSLSKINIIPPLQRQEAPKPKSDEEKYEEAAKKIGEAFLETPTGKEIKRKAEELGDDFIATLPGKIVTGVGIGGAIAGVAALAVEGEELPVGIPEIPLDSIKPGLKLKLTIEGPLNKPTKVTAGFSFPLGVPKETGRKQPTKAERFRAETARMAAEQQRFRDSLKSPAQRAAEQDFAMTWVMSQAYIPGVGPNDPRRFTTPLQAPYNLPTPLAPYASEFKISEEEPQKKKEEGVVQRKTTTKSSSPATAPPIVDSVINSPGKPMESKLRKDMEKRFGYDFSRVRIHTDTLAGQSAAALEAEAYSVGNNLVFAKDRYAPTTPQGRHLLAHELAHFVQQNNPQKKSEKEHIVRRKKKGTSPVLTPALALRNALHGDDDSVRALTKSPQWKDVVLSSEEAASLLVLLLKGVTLDDDETAGLAVLKKSLEVGIFDDSLKKLGTQGKFKQLLDDFHGGEYQKLLDLLSKKIDKLAVKALYLDSFIAMWWVREHEERAIVLLLERTKAADLTKLLSHRNREEKLRGAIDETALSIRYEKVVSKTNEQRTEELSKKLRKFFTVHIRHKDAPGNRTPVELRNAATSDLMSDLSIELAQYRKRLQDVLLSPSSNVATLSKINKDFEHRLKALAKSKREEFRLEIKYGVELNRLIKHASGRSWSEDDLKEIDKILAQIPPEILAANRAFKWIKRAGYDEKYAGLAFSPGEKIHLFNQLTLDTTAHEMGHIISYDNEFHLQNTFDKKFHWEQLHRSSFTTLIHNEKDRQQLLAKLDADRTAKRKNKEDRHLYGNHYYRFDYYSDAGTYLRHPKDGCFISDYAATNHKEDFAESFAEYVVRPRNLYNKCRKKYNFIRKDVFVNYLFGKFKDKVLADYERTVRVKLNSIFLYGDLEEKITEYIQNLRSKLLKELEAREAGYEKKSMAEVPTNKMDPTPIPTTTERLAVRQVLGRYHILLTDLFDLIQPVSIFWYKYNDKLWQFLHKSPEKYRESADKIRIDLSKCFGNEAIALLHTVAQKVTGGARIKIKKWTDLENLYKKYLLTLKVAPSYLPQYNLLFDAERKIALKPHSEKDEVGPTAWSFLRRYPKKHPRRQVLKQYLLKRRKILANEMKQVRKELIIKDIVAGVPANKTTVPLFSELVRTYKRDIKKFIKVKKIRLQRKEKGHSLRP